MNFLASFIFILTITIHYAPSVNAETRALDFDTYLPPTSSTLCASLKKSLKERKKHKQKLTYLLMRNKALLREVSKRKKSIVVKLKENQGEIKIKQQKNRLQIETIEEKVIRKGCPGILTPSFEEKTT